jgi:glutamate racemase
LSYDDRPIGVFDSGIGGLTVARLISRELPGEDLIYLGDTLHVPYGDKSESELIMYARTIMDFFVDQGAKAIVAACNTSSSVSLPVLTDRYQVPVIGVIKPGAKAALESSRNRRIGVLATEATVRSSAYRREIQNLNRDAEVWEVSCPRLVPMVEAGLVEDREAREVISHYVAGLKKNDADTIVLGCTHYPYLTPWINGIVGDGVVIVDPAVETTRDLKLLLEENDSLSRREQGSIRYLATGPDQSFYQLGKLFMGEKFSQVEQVVIF